MSYQAHYINPLIQFGRAEFDLILEDDAGIRPTLRLPKSFLIGVTQEDLDAEAVREIDKALLDQYTDHRFTPPTLPTDVQSDVDLPENITL